MEFEAANGHTGIIREPVEERLQELRSALDEFARTPDAPSALAGRIEVLLDDLYSDVDYLQEAVEMLACYSTGGEEWTVDWESMRSRLMRVQHHLETLWTASATPASLTGNHDVEH